MGAKNIDRYSPSDWRSGAETVEAMLTRGWEVTTRCDRCRVEQLASLTLIARLKGPHFSLWNQSTACKVLRCGGRLRFFGRPPRLHSAFELSAPDPSSWPPRA